MKLEINAPDRVPEAMAFQVRVLLLNDSYAPASISRNALFGPTPEAPGMLSAPAVEATFGLEEQPLTLQPFTFYGRERQIDGQPPGSIRISARYLTQDGELTAQHIVQIG